MKKFWFHKEWERTWGSKKRAQYLVKGGGRRHPRADLHVISTWCWAVVRTGLKEGKVLGGLHLHDLICRMTHGGDNRGPGLWFGRKEENKEALTLGEVGNLADRVHSLPGHKDYVKLYEWSILQQSLHKWHCARQGSAAAGHRWQRVTQN